MNVHRIAGIFGRNMLMGIVLRSVGTMGFCMKEEGAEKGMRDMARGVRELE